MPTTKRVERMDLHLHSRQDQFCERCCTDCRGTGCGPEWRGGDLVEDFELCPVCGGYGERTVPALRGEE